MWMREKPCYSDNLWDLLSQAAETKGDFVRLKWPSVSLCFNLLRDFIGDRSVSWLHRLRPIPHVYNLRRCGSTNISIGAPPVPLPTNTTIFRAMHRQIAGIFVPCSSTVHWRRNRKSPDTVLQQQKHAAS